MKKVCKNCKWWECNERNKEWEWGICYNQTGHKGGDDYGAVTIMKGAYTSDGSAYYSALNTKPDFGCNEFEEK